MKDFLDKLSTTISGQSGTFTVQYENGEYKGYCKYVSFPKTRYQTEPIYLMVECEMGDIIEWVHKNDPLSSDKFTEVSMGIREHSLDVLTTYLHNPDGI